MIKINKKNYNFKNNSIKELDSKDYGIVIETTYNKATCLYKDELIDVTLDKSIKGIINKLVYTGDKVVISNNKIMGIIKRKNILSRDKNDATRNNGMVINHIVATNIDIALIVVASKEPDLHPKLIDRYIILLENAKIPYVIVLSKSDLMDDKASKILEVYENMGIRVIKTSIVNKDGINSLKEILNGKQAILLGHSGVGKSSLTKEIVNDDKILIGKLRDKNKKGRHTTTTSIYYEWNDNSSIIDTPGIRSLDISSFKKEEIQYYFKEIVKYRDLCKYKDCLHNLENDGDCEIKRQVKNGNITEERYESYIKLISQCK